MHSKVDAVAVIQKIIPIEWSCRGLGFSSVVLPPTSQVQGPKFDRWYKKKKSLNGILILGSSDRCKYTDTERVKRKLRHVGHWALKLPLRIEMTRAGLGGTRCSPDSPLRGDLLVFE